MFRTFENLIDPFRRHDDTMPPATLIAFYWRYCRQVWPWLLALMAVGLVVSLIEVSMMRYIGSIVDLLKTTTPASVFQDYGPTFLWMGFVVAVAAPISHILHDLLNQQAIAPSLTNLVRWQTHRYVLRQSVTFFANDFAGRIASKIVQTGPALRESVTQLIDAIWFVAIFAVSALVIFWEADWRLTVPLSIWIVGYVATLACVRAAHPRPRDGDVEGALGADRPHRRQLHQHPDGEALRPCRPRGRLRARDPEGAHRDLPQRRRRLITAMNATVSCLNGILIVGTGALALWLWLGASSISLGAIAVAAGAVDPHLQHVRLDRLGSRSASSSRWAPCRRGWRRSPGPMTLLDKPAAPPLVVRRGEIRFDDVTLPLWQGRRASSRSCRLTIAPGEKVGLVGRSGAGKSTLVNLLLRFYDVERGTIRIDGQDIAARHAGEPARSRSASSRRTRRCCTARSRDNIRYGQPRRARGRRGSRRRGSAHATEFIGGLERSGVTGAGSMPMSASAASSSPAASASASPSRGCS